jgi:hypothetical protein
MVRMTFVGRAGSRINTPAKNLLDLVYYTARVSKTSERKGGSDGWTPKYQCIARYHVAKARRQGQGLRQGSSKTVVISPTYSYTSLRLAMVIT